MNIFIYIGDIESDIEEIILKQKNNFKAKYSESNIINIDFLENDNILELKKILKDSYKNISLFAEKKLIFLKNLFQVEDDFQLEILEYLKKSDNNFITIIQDNKIDKRTKFWKEIEKMSILSDDIDPKLRIQEIKFTKDYDIKKWIIKKILDNGYQISEKALNKLMEKFNLRKDYKNEYIGKIDTIKIKTQLLKLFNSKNDNLIKEDDIKLSDVNYSNPNDDDIFELVNLIFEKNKKALILFEKNFYNDTNEKLKLDELVFFNTIMINNLEEMISVSDLIFMKYPDLEISKEMNWKNPKKIFPIKIKLKNFNKELLKKYYKQFEEIDILSKTDQEISLYKLNLLILDMIQK